VKIPLPNLDDRSWSDLVDEGRSLIPFYAPQWTDHNLHDPGITLLELLASVAEIDIYRLNRISAERKRKLLSLVGLKLEPLRAARVALGLTLQGDGKGEATLRLRASTEFAGLDPLGQETRYRILKPIEVAPGRLRSIQIRDARGFHDLTERWQRGDSFGLFGEIPEPGSELYLGFTSPFQKSRPVSLYFKFDDAYSGADERRRIIEEAAAYRKACHPAAIPCQPEHGAARLKRKRAVKRRLTHHWVRTGWEFLSSVEGERKWLALEPTVRDVVDDTRSFTLDGSVEVKVTAAMLAASVGEVEEKLYYLRCRFEAGAYDAPPKLQAVLMNGILAEQAIPVSTSWVIQPGVVAEGDAPEISRFTGLRLEFNAQGEINRLRFERGNRRLPRFRVLAYKPATHDRPGRLTIEAARLADGNGRPDQELELPSAPAQESSFRLLTFEHDEWRRWDARRDFDSSTQRDAHFLIDATRGVVSFGDGQRGRVPAKDALVLAVYRSTRAEGGNLAARTINELADSPHNRALVENFDAVKKRLASIINPLAASSGAPAESIDSLIARAIDITNTTERAVTLEDYARLARRTPGARLARATARANLHPSFPCFQAPGIVTLIILPDMPVARPTPSPGLLKLVAAHLHYRRIIGTRLEVVAPNYLEVSVRASVKAHPGVSVANLQPRIVEALNDFLDPLKGGPDKTGWPFGRDVFRSEVMQVIDEVEGVDFVISLELIAEGCEPQCGSVCLAPTWLVTPGQHTIKVV
jgi:predicted phage baseplate assembly protein